MSNQTIITDKAVSISYILKNDEGEVLDVASPDDPMWFLQGAGSLLPAVEAALEGKKVGDTLALTLSAEEAYGEYDANKVREVPRDAFPDDFELEVGMPFMIDADGDMGDHPWFITDIEGDTVVMDGNHPLAGQGLEFEIVVEDIRDADPEELDHGHVHGAGGHHHH